MLTIFLDTNKIFGAYRYFVYHDCSLGKSDLINLKKENNLVISYFVLQELIEICTRKDIPISTQLVENFCNYIGIFLTTSKKITNNKLITHVNDINDTQILQDAINVQANVLLTNNLKDFNTKNIKIQFNITVTNFLHQNTL